jgi:hypothetical protein
VEESNVVAAVVAQEGDQRCGLLPWMASKALLWRGSAVWLCGPHRVAIAYVDVTTGMVKSKVCAAEEVMDALTVVRADEILFPLAGLGERSPWKRARG